MFEVYLSRRALNDLKNIKGKSLKRIEDLLLKLKTNPLPARGFHVQKIKNVSDVYRARISRYRIIYKVRWGSHEIYVVKIVKRDEKTYRL